MKGKGAEIPATMRVILAGLGVGPVVASLANAHLESSGALDSQWASDVLFDSPKALARVWPSPVQGAMTGKGRHIATTVLRCQSGTLHQLNTISA